LCFAPQSLSLILPVQVCAAKPVPANKRSVPNKSLFVIVFDYENVILIHYEGWSACRRTSGTLDAGLVVADVAAIVKRTRIERITLFSQTRFAKADWRVPC
jgi:hypothetical protein